MSAKPQTLPDLSSEYPISAAQVEAYQRNGHVLLRSVLLPDEVAAYRRVLNDAVSRLNPETRPLEERDTYGKAFLQTMNLWEHDEGARQFTFARRFAKIAADLMEAQRVRLYHDQALYKEPGGGHTPWHQDQYYWPLDTQQTITLWMPLVEATPEMGTMVFASGSHHEGFLGHLEISDESESRFNEFVRDRGYKLSPCGAMAAGDASFHSGWTLHSAPGNATDRMREAMTVIYFADGTRILEPDNKNRWDDLERWLPGQKPGEPAASRLNPVLYP